MKANSSHWQEAKVIKEIHLKIKKVDILTNVNLFLCATILPQYVSLKYPRAFHVGE